MTFAAVEELANVQRFMEDDVSDRDRRQARANADLGWPVAADHAVRNAARPAEVDGLAGFGRSEPADQHARQAEVLRGERQGVRRGKARRKWDGRRVDLRAIEEVVVQDELKEDAPTACLVQMISGPHNRQASRTLRPWR